MVLKSIFIFSIQACLIQIAFSQCAKNAAYGPQIGALGGGLGPLGPGPIGPGAIGPANPAYGYGNPGYNPGYGAAAYPGAAYGPGSYPGAACAPFPGYGGSGGGDVAVAGELPVGGTTTVAGNVPVIGGVQFGGTIPASGFVTISGICSCGGY